MAVPKFKMSRSNTRSRRSQWKAEVPRPTPPIVESPFTYALLAG